MKKSWVVGGGAIAVIVCGVAAYVLGYVPDSWPTVKGIYLGMSEEQLTAILPQERKFTIAGVHDATAVPEFMFIHGRLAEFKFRIPEGAYAPVRDAVKAKYPLMRCHLMMIDRPDRTQMPHEECKWGSLVIVQSVFGQGVDPDRVVLTRTPYTELRRHR